MCLCLCDASLFDARECFSFIYLLVYLTLNLLNSILPAVSHANQHFFSYILFISTLTLLNNYLLFIMSHATQYQSLIYLQ